MLFVPIFDANKVNMIKITASENCFLNNPYKITNYNVDYEILVHINGGMAID